MDRFEITYLFNIVIGYFLYEKRSFYPNADGNPISIPYSDLKDDHFKLRLFFYILENLYQLDSTGKVQRKDDIKIVTDCDMDTYLENISESFNILDKNYRQTNMVPLRTDGTLRSWYRIYAHSKTPEEGIKNFLRYIDFISDIVCSAVGVLQKDAEHYGLRDKNDEEKNILRNISCINLIREDYAYNPEVGFQDFMDKDKIYIIYDAKRLSDLLKADLDMFPFIGATVNCNNKTLEYIINHDKQNPRHKIIKEVINNAQLCTSYCKGTRNLCSILSRILRKKRTENDLDFQAIEDSLISGIKRGTRKFASRELIRVFERRGFAKCSGRKI